MTAQPPPPTNPYWHPARLGVVLTAFTVLFIGVLYAISPIPDFRAELLATATSDEAIWQTKTSERRPKPLPADEHHWMVFYQFTGIHGERGFHTVHYAPGADKPAAGDTMTVRYQPSPELAGLSNPASTPCRPAEGVTLLGEGKYVIAGMVFATLFLFGAWVLNWKHWQSANRVLLELREGTITGEEARLRMYGAMFGMSGPVSTDGRE